MEAKDFRKGIPELLTFGAMVWYSTGQQRNTDFMGGAVGLEDVTEITT